MERERGRERGERKGGREGLGERERRERREGRDGERGSIAEFVLYRMCSLWNLLEA
jgi:hypothetical protein